MTSESTDLMTTGMKAVNHLLAEIASYAGHENEHDEKWSGE